MKKFIIFLLITILSITTIACSNDKDINKKPGEEKPATQDPVIKDPTGKTPEGYPKDTIEAYYADLEAGDYESAYNMLSQELKKDVDLERFSLWNSLLAQGVENTTYRFDLQEEKKNADLDGTQFEYINNFKINKAWLDLYTGEQQAYDTEEYVVAENNEWKVYRLKEDFDVDAKIASNYNILGMMYSYGRGVEADQNKSLEMFEEAVKYDDTNYFYYYGMSNTFLNLEKLDEADASANKALELLGKYPDNPNLNYDVALANTNNVLGVIYQRKGDVEKAREYYTTALEYNPENAQARQNLDGLK